MMMKRVAVCAFVGAVGALLHSPTYAAEPCTASCAVLSVGSVEGGVGGAVMVPVSFTPGPNDGVSGSGNDEISAIAFTLGIPGSGSATPLTLANCSDGNGDGLPDAIVVNPAIRDTLRVVVENTECVNRNRCLCPTGAQTRDNFINVVVYGPKDLPAEGPIDIPVIPAGELFKVTLQIASGTPVSTDIPLHIFSEVDDPQGQPKPQFGAFASIGDRAAVDQTVDRDADRSKLTTSDGVVHVIEGVAVCTGDCNNDRTVTVDELVRGVNLSLLNGTGDCLAFDRDLSNMITVDELVSGVNNAQIGCP